MNSYSFPKPENESQMPIWTGEKFLLGEKEVGVLEYSENFAGWNDSLSELLDESSSGMHPIDISSRLNVIEQISKFSYKEDLTILEIGCSSGYMLQDIKGAFPFATVIGVDVVKQTLYNLAEKNLGIPLLRFDLLQCPLPEKSVDIVICLNVLEHIENDKEALKQIYKLLKKDGIAIIEVPAVKSLYDSYDKELQHFRRYSMKEIVYKAQDAQFEIISKSHLGFLVFPGFALVKFFNKQKAVVALSQQSREKVGNQIIATKGSKIFAFAIKIENMLRKHIRFPFGIRCNLTMKK